jgi:protein involved in polysaccharide export with SLBB domain
VIPRNPGRGGLDIKTRPEGQPAMKLSTTVLTTLALIGSFACTSRAQNGQEPVQNVYHPGDAIELDVIGYEEELNGIYEVTPDGELAIPYIGRLRAAGLPEKELDRVLTERIHRYYINEPQVVITPLYSITVLGSVYRPGPYQIQGGEPVSRLIGLAGGTRDNASIGSVRVTRDGESQKLNLKSALQDGRSVNDIGIRSGDVIYVPQRSFFSDWRNWAVLISSASLAFAIYDRVQN